MRRALSREEESRFDDQSRVFIITVKTQRSVAPRAVHAAVRSQLVTTKRSCARASKPRASTSCCGTDTNIVTTQTVTASADPRDLPRHIVERPDEPCYRAKKLGQHERRDDVRDAARVSLVVRAEVGRGDARKEWVGDYLYEPDEANERERRCELHQERRFRKYHVSAAARC